MIKELMTLLFYKKSGMEMRKSSIKHQIRALVELFWGEFTKLHLY